MAASGESILSGVEVKFDSQNFMILARRATNPRLVRQFLSWVSYMEDHEGHTFNLGQKQIIAEMQEGQ